MTDRDYLITPCNGRPLHAIEMEICAKHKMTPAQLRGQRRLPAIAEARQEFYWLAYTETEASLPQIARYMGGRHHTTVMSGIKRHQERVGVSNGAA